VAQFKQRTLNSKADVCSSLVADDVPATAYSGGALHCVVSRSDGFLFLNSARASLIAVCTRQLYMRQIPSLPFTDIEPLQIVKVKVNVDLYSTYCKHTSNVLRYSMCSQGISRFYLHTPPSSAN